MSTPEAPHSEINYSLRRRLALGALGVGLFAGGFGGYEFQKSQESLTKGNALAAAAVDAACIDTIEQSGAAASPHPSVRFNLAHPAQVDSCSPYFSDSLSFDINSLGGIVTDVTVQMPPLAELKADEARHLDKARHYIGTWTRLGEVAAVGFGGLFGAIAGGAGLIGAVRLRERFHSTPTVESSTN